MAWVPTFMVVHSAQVYIQLKPLFSRHKGIGVQFTDEPTGSLDKKNRDIVMNLLHELNEEGKTVIIVTHDQSIIENEPYVVKI